jgi:hypothetical protein
MRKYNDFKSERASSGGRETLPAGGYVCQIISAKVDSNEWGETLVIAHDVCEGEYEGIFKRDYENNDREDKKWRGTFRLNLPKDDGSEQDAWKKRSFNGFIWAIEQSNPGFVWDWDEKKLKGKKVGLLYRNEEWAIDGRSGWTTKAAYSESVENVRNGKFKMPKDKPLPESKKVDTTPQFTELDDSDGELPF